MGRVIGMVRNVQNFPAYLLHKWGLKREDPFVLRSLEGVSVEVPDRMMHTAKEVFFTDDYRFDQIKARVLALSQKPVIIDVGANVGYLSAFSFTRFPDGRVISVEPIPKNLALLETNRKRNPERDWTVFEGVLSGADGSVDIRFDSSDSFTTSASLYGLDASNDLLQVASKRLDTLMMEQGVESVHILKLDCEGGEYDVLYALDHKWLNRIAFITMETHPIDDERSNRDSLVSWLNGKGWKTNVIRSKVLAENPSFSRV